MPPKAKKLPWSETHKKNLSWLFNTYKETHPDANKETFIDINKRSLMTFIEKHEAWGDGSKEAHLFMVARYLNNKNPLDAYSKRYSAEGYKLMMKNRNKEDDNQLDAKELLSYRSHEFFEALIEDIDTTTITTKEEHMKYLLLNMLVYQPPLRTSFYSSCKIIRTKKENDKENNFISINRRGSLKVSYIVNKDKASNYKIYKMNKNLSSILVEDKKLAELINESYNEYPRDYLFVGNQGNNKVSDGTLLTWLKDITGINGLNFDIMRSSYITWFYQNNKTFGQKTKLAHQMRHSAETAARNYNKIFETSPEVIQNQNIELLLKLKALEEQLKDSQLKSNTLEVDSKLYKKRRSNIIYRLNKGTTPKESTLNVYGITQDEETKLYK